MMNSQEPIAIVGMGCRLPKASDIEAFFRLLRGNVDAIGEVPSDRWGAEAIYHPDRAAPGRTYARRGGFIEQVDAFDAAFFGISPREATSMDPQTRLMLEVASETFADAGFDRRRYANTTGIYVGVSGSDYQDMLLADRYMIDGYMATGTATSIAANRISHAFDLHGPSLAVDTACSSSLVAVHLACASLRGGECDAALAGGVGLLLRPETTIAFSKGFMLSPDAKCMAFDARGNGFVRGEGAGAILLKRLSDAVRDEDSVYAVILATHVNQDGHTSHGIAVPNVEAQKDALIGAYNKAGIQPHHVRYVEAHGPGTPVGDPVEAEALGTVLGVGRRPGEELVIGSVKTNIGHLEPAAGIAGLMKAALALSHETLFANLHFESPSPRIPMEQLRLRVATQNEPWPVDLDRPRIAGVNSFGFGGTNAHAVLAGAEIMATDNARWRHGSPTTAGGSPTILTLSARSPEALRASVSRMVDWLEEDGATSDLGDICYSAGARREHHEHRIALPATARTEVVAQLKDWAAGQLSPGLSSGHASGSPPRVGFVLCGMGSHWWGMGRELFASQPTFRRELEACDAEIRSLANWCLIDELQRTEGDTRLTRFEIGQPAMFAVQCGLVALWRSHGVEPSAIVGHSVGEVAAAHVAGALSRADAVKIVVARSRLQQQTQGQGRLLAVSLSEEAIARFLVGHEDAVSVAAVNAPGALTLAGDPAVLENIARALEPSGTFCRFLRADVPAHSPAMEPLLAPLLLAVKNIEPRSADVPLYSTVTGARAADGAMGAQYWGRNLRETVRFATAARAMFDDGIEVFVEISPHPVLSTSLVECAAHADRMITVLSSLRRGSPEVRSILETLSALQVRGLPLPAHAFGEGRVISLPTYPWQRERYWKEPQCSVLSRSPRLGAPLLGIARPTPESAWEVEIERHAFGYMYDHRVQGAVIWPAAGYVEMALQAVAEIRPDAAVRLRDLELHRAMVMPTETMIVARVARTEEDRVSIHSRDTQLPDWELNASVGYELGTAGSPPRIALDTIRTRCPEVLTSGAFYDKLERMGDDFGPAFRSVVDIRLGNLECLARIEIPQGVVVGRPGMRVHPVLLDGCFQALVANLPQSAEGSALPVRVREIRILTTAVAGPVYAHARLVGSDFRGFRGDLDVTDAEGQVLIEVRGFEFQSLEAAARCNNSPLHVSSWQLSEPAPDSSVKWRSPSATGPELARLGERLGSAHSRGRHYLRARPALDALARSYVVEALSDLGIPLVPGQRFDRDRLLETAGVVSRHERVFNRMIDEITRAGLWEEQGSALTVRRSHTPCSADQMSALRGALPEYAAELALLNRCGKRLAMVLRGEEEPLSLVFPEGASSELEHLYSTGPTAYLYNRFLAEAIARLLGAEPRRGLRILEVGAGTGGTTVHLLEGLQSLGTDTSEYVCTDVSRAFLARAAQRFSTYPFFTCRSFDLDQDPEVQGFAKESFDLVVAADVVHATRDVRRSIDRLKSTLRPGGLLALIELTNPPFWPDMTFGLLDGWWAFSDSDLRPDHALMESARWCHVMAQAGLDVVALSECPDIADGEQTIILGVKSSEPSVESVVPWQLGGRWLVVGEQAGLAGHLAERLTSTGDASSLADETTAPEALLALVDSLGCEEHGATHVVYCPAADGSNEAQTARALTERGVDFAQVLTRGGYAGRLSIVTVGAQAVHSNDDANVGQAALWGLARVASNEHPEWQVTMIDVDNTDVSTIIRLTTELAARSPEDEVAIRKEGRYVRRWRRIPEASHRAEPNVTPSDIPEDAVVIDVDVVGLPAMETPGHSCHRVWELSGRIHGVGNKVSALEVGDDIVALSFEEPGAHVVLPAGFVVRRPTALGAAPAAAGMAGFVAFDLLLREDAVLSPGAVLWVHGSPERVLLLSAAITYAVARGIEVVVSSDDAAQAARVLGRAVLDGHSIRLAEDVRGALNGRTADALLLLGPAPVGPDADELLSSGARIFFVPGALDPPAMRPTFSRGATLLPFDQVAILRRHPKVRASLQFLAEEMAGGRLDPLPHRVLVGNDARFAAIIPAPDIKQLSQRQASRQPPIEHRVRPDATYLITGGLGGLGLRLAGHLVDRGATRLVLVGRRGAASERAQQDVESLRSRGVEVIVESADVSQRSALERVLVRARTPERPLRGVVYAAMVLEDALIDQLDSARIHRVMTAKVDGAVHLDELTRDDSLDFFVLFSSFASVVGNPGQGAYAAANAALDALAVRRRVSGRPAISIGWGSVAGAGYVAEHGGIDAHLRNLGIVPLSGTHAMDIFDQLINSRAAHVASIDVDWWQWCSVHSAGSAPRFSELLVADSTGKSAHTASGPDGANTGSTLDVIRAEAARVLRMPVERLDVEVSLGDYGFDSLMAVELRAFLRGHLGAEVPAMKLLGGPTILELTALVEEQRTPAVVERTPRRPTTVEPSRLSRWLVCRRRHPDPEARLFCIPYNGGSAATYSVWTDLVPASVEVHAVRLPGQMDRRDERVPNHLVEWARELADAVEPFADRPCALYGHSLGGLVAFELARELRRRGVTAPVSLFVGAVQAPHLADPFPDTDRLTDLTTLRRLGMLDTLAPVLADHQMVAELRPIIQSGIELLKRYRCEAMPPLAGPIVAFGGRRDAVVFEEHLADWREHTRAGFELRFFEGGHLFHQEQSEAVVSAIIERMLLTTGGLQQGKVA